MASAAFASCKSLKGSKLGSCNAITLSIQSVLMSGSPSPANALCAGTSKRSHDFNNAAFSAECDFYLYCIFTD